MSEPAGIEAEPGLPSTPFTYDGNVNALYYRLTTAEVARTIAIGDRVNVDVDADGEAIGIEVLDPPGFSSSILGT